MCCARPTDSRLLRYLLFCCVGKVIDVPRQYPSTGPRVVGDLLKGNGMEPTHLISGRVEGGWTWTRRQQRHLSQVPSRQPQLLLQLQVCGEGLGPLSAVRPLLLLIKVSSNF